MLPREVGRAEPLWLARNFSSGIIVDAYSGVSYMLWLARNFSSGIIVGAVPPTTSELWLARNFSSGIIARRLNVCGFGYGLQGILVLV